MAEAVHYIQSELSQLEDVYLPIGLVLCNIITDFVYPLCFMGVSAIGHVDLYKSELLEMLYHRPMTCSYATKAAARSSNFKDFRPVVEQNP